MIPAISRFSTRLIVFFCCLFPALSSAHEDTLYYNQVSIEASASAEVENDTMRVQMYAMHEAIEAADASERVNQRMNRALTMLNNYAELEVATEAYTTSPVYNKSQIVSWRVRQGISIESRDMAQLSQVLGKLQGILNLSSVSFDVSKATRARHTDSLIEEALAAFDSRSKLIAGKIKGGDYRLVRMNVSTSSSDGGRPYMAMRAMAAEADSFKPVTSPQTEGGKSTLTVRISGTIELQ